MAIPAFIFGGDTGETPQSIAQKRALIAQIMGSSRAPSNVGEGFSAIGDGIVANVLGRRAEEAETKGQESAAAAMNPIYAALTGQGAPMPSYGPATASDATAAMAGGGDFLSGLVQSESGGNWQALNDEGYGGRLQFGEARLADAAQAGVIPPGMTGAEFAMMSPEVQQAVEQWHFSDIENQAAQMGLDRYYGQTIAGVPINADSVKAMAHLGGIGGVQKFVESGGRYNPADSNGTRLSDYGARFGGAPAQVAQGPDLTMLMEAAANPWLSDSQKAVINSMLSQQMQQMDPAYQQQLQAGQLGIERAQLELEELRNKPPPLPGAPKTEKIYDPETGREKVVQWNEYTGAWEDLGGVSAPKEPLVQVSTGDAAPGLGKLSTDYGYVLDPATGLPRIDPATGLPQAAPVPGSPAAIAAEQAAAAQASQEGAQIASDIEGAEKTLMSTRNVLDILDNTEGQPTTGTLSRPFALLSNTPAGRIRSYVSTLQSGVALGAMQRLKEASSTGATGFGALSAPELNLLISDIGALDPDNTEPDIFRQTVQRIEDRAKRVVADIRKNVSPERIQELGLQEFLDAFDPPAPNQSTVPATDIDALLELYR